MPITRRQSNLLLAVSLLAAACGEPPAELSAGESDSRAGNGSAPTSGAKADDPRHVCPPDLEDWLTLCVDDLVTWLEPAPAPHEALQICLTEDAAAARDHHCEDPYALPSRWCAAPFAAVLGACGHALDARFPAPSPPARLTPVRTALRAAPDCTGCRAALALWAPADDAGLDALVSASAPVLVGHGAPASTDLAPDRDDLEWDLDWAAGDGLLDAIGAGHGGIDEAAVVRWVDDAWTTLFVLRLVDGHVLGVVRTDP